MIRLLRYLKTLLDRCLGEDNVNSRLAFLSHALVSSVCVLILVIAFVCAKDKTGYDYMIMAVGGSNAGAAVGRYLTKKGDQTTELESK